MVAGVLQFEYAASPRQPLVDGHVVGPGVRHPFIIHCMMPEAPEPNPLRRFQARTPRSYSSPRSSPRWYKELHIDGSAEGAAAGAVIGDLVAVQANAAAHHRLAVAQYVIRGADARQGEKRFRREARHWNRRIDGVP